MNNCMIFTAAVLLCGGCFFSRGTALKVARYQAEFSSTSQPDPRFRVGAVSNISGAGKEFLVSGKNSEVRTLAGRCWLNSPEVMLKSALLLNFPGGRDAAALSAQIVRFDFDAELKNLEAVIIFSVRSDRNIVCVEKVAVENENYGKAAAQVFENAIQKFVKTVK